MSMKHKIKESLSRKRQEEQANKVMKGVIGALILLAVLSLIAFAILGSEF